METFYRILVFLHIFSAIVGIGPGFVLTTITKFAKTLPQIRYAHFVKLKVHVLVMVGGTIVLLTGLTMGALKPVLFQQGWYLTSMILYLIGLALGPTLLKKHSRAIKEILDDPSLEELPPEYYESSRKLLKLEYLVNTALIIVIILMITKPF